MHSTQAPSGQHYHHNGDYSGAVKAYVPIRPQTRWPKKDVACASHPVKGIDFENPDAEYVEVEIPFEDMKRLVIDSFRSRLISHLESSDDETLERLFLGAFATEG